MPWAAKFSRFFLCKASRDGCEKFLFRFGLMKIILQNWVWNNLAFIMGHANIPFFKEVPNSIKDTVTIQQ
jgi:hypothetical protein